MIIHFKIYDLDQEKYLDTKRFTFTVEASDYIENTYDKLNWDRFEIHEFKRNGEYPTTIKAHKIGIETIKIERPTI